MKISALTPISPVSPTAVTIIVSGGVSYKATIADVLGALTGNPSNIAGFDPSTGKISDLGFSAAAFAASSHNHDSRYLRYDTTQVLSSPNKTNGRNNLGLGTMSIQNSTDYYTISDVDGEFATLATTDLLADEFTSIATDVENHLADANNPHSTSLGQVGFILTKTITFDAGGFALSIGTDSAVIRIPAGFRSRKWTILGDANVGLASFSIYSTTAGMWPAATILSTLNTPQLVEQYVSEFVYGVGTYIDFTVETMIFFRLVGLTGPYTKIQILMDFEAVA